MANSSCGNTETGGCTEAKRITRIAYVDDEKKERIQDRIRTTKNTEEEMKIYEELGYAEEYTLSSPFDEK